VLTLRLDHALRAMLARGDWASQPIVRTWIRDGQMIAACQISLVRSESSEVRVQLNTRLGTTTCTETLALDWVAQRLGGRRAWLICPKCLRRCGVLFNLLRASWRCRRCYQITYTSSNLSERRVTRMLRSPNLASMLRAVDNPNSIGDLVLQQKATLVIRRRARRDYRRWFRRTFPGRHLPGLLR
jgi:hypothetical protein